MRKVLLLGSTGAVGSGCLDVLSRRDDLAIVIAGRDEARLRAVASTKRSGVEVTRLDIADVPAVTATAAHCDIVVNCAGPSYRFSSDVARAAVGAGAAYVDPGGDQTLLDSLAAIETTAPVVLQTGVQPGLSGLLLRALALRHPERIENMHAWCGGLQPLTAAAVHEYLASLESPHSYPASALRGGAVRRVRNEECVPAPAQYFPDTASVHPHLDSETIAVAAQLGIGKVWWANVLDGARTIRAIHLLAAEDRQGCRDKDLREVLAAVKLDLFGRAAYFAIVCAAQSDSVSTTLAVTCENSYRVSGALAAFAAQRVTRMTAGVHPFWTVDVPWDVLAFLAATVPDFAVSFAGDASPVPHSALSAAEEGSL